MGKNAAKSLHEALADLGLTSRPCGDGRRMIFNAVGQSIGALTAAEGWALVHQFLHQQKAAGLQTCPRCNGEGWLEPIGPCDDGSYITSRPCPRCDQRGRVAA